MGKANADGIARGRDRFLARVLDAALRSSWRTPAEFFGAFEPATVMAALEPEPALRLRLLTDGARIHPKVAARKSPGAACEDLQLAYEEGVVSADDLLSLIPMAARVRYLDSARLWAFATSGDWLSRPDRGDTAGARQRVGTILEAALDEGLLEPSDLRGVADYDALAERVDPEALRRVFSAALNAARERAPLSEDLLLEVVDWRTLVDAADPRAAWQSVILGVLLPRCGFSSRRSERPAPARTRAPSQPVAAPSPRASDKPIAPPRPAAVRPMPPRPRPPSRESVPFHEDAAPERTSSPSLPRFDLTPTPSPMFLRSLRSPANPRGLVLAEETFELDVYEDDFELLDEVDEASGHTSDRRRAITDQLRHIGRLPANHQYLGVVILQSISSMYDEIKKVRGLEERAERVRSCFSNEAHLRTAMLALLEVVKPDLSKEDPLIRDGHPDALVDLLLYEEFQLWKQTRRRSRPDRILPKRRSEYARPQAPPSSSRMRH